MLSYRIADDGLLRGCQRNHDPSIAIFIGIAYPDVALLGMNELPLLINFDQIALEIAEQTVMQARASFADGEARRPIVSR